MKALKYIEQPTTYCKDLVLDNIHYHIEYNTENEALFLYIPQMAITCKASELEATYPDVIHLDYGLLYPGILDFISSKKSVKSVGKGNNKRLMITPISFIDYVYQIAYERDTDYLLLIIPSRSIHTDILTIDVIFPEIGKMHKGLLLEVIKTYVEKYRS